MGFLSLLSLQPSLPRSAFPSERWCRSLKIPNTSLEKAPRFVRKYSCPQVHKLYLISGLSCFLSNPRHLTLLPGAFEGGLQGLAASPTAEVLLNRSLSSRAEAGVPLGRSGLARRGAERRIVFPICAAFLGPLGAKHWQPTGKYQGY